ncbi:hypothetical protein SPRG_01868 [Saprolegnia parasitica CBS 223.65]|uniref:Dynein light chain n=1 Tax=Saprolegnia parasitica (strain CBS 223.65) TaxID=695850 RepID=A0A067CRB1_SAPPC|nr:hypothetical protein SPRG_01868 [Saprolegnia parasitica CBS 223.65]KDO33053.1 hypothetical protein SPRG_01868 [Saprolegnia parasitica CBS 223.65]|eukprot:XP_012195824.1 hypothetical protein SPRG_01868 [Saprolegnia parasitica CBS 223.65]
MAPPTDIAPEGAVKERRDPKITLMRVEMTTAMKDEAISHLAESLVTNVIEKDIATDMKKYFDQKYGPTWHCIVGKGFGCSIAYDTQFLLFFKMDQHYLLLFKSTE